MNGKNLSRGFTLVELMVTVIVLAILVGVAVPGLDTLMRRNRIATASSDFSAAVAYARGEAVRRGKTVSLCPASGGLKNGWTVGVGKDCSGDALAKHDALKLIEFSGAPTTGNLNVNSMGVGTGAWINAAFYMQVASCSTGQPGLRRKITVTPLLEVDAEQQPCAN